MAVRQIRSVFLLMGVIVAGSLRPAAAQSVDIIKEARALIAEGDYQEAAVLLEADSTSTDGYFLLGLSYQAMQQNERAYSMLSQADTLDKRVLAATGRSLDMLGRPEEAERYYLRAYHLDLTSVPTASSLARLYADRGFWNGVHDIYKRLLEEDKENSTLHAQLARAFVGLDSLEGAIVHFERAHWLNLKNVTVSLQLSKVYIDHEHYISARRVIDRGLDEHPRNTKLWQRRGDIALIEEDYHYALKSFRNAIANGDSTALNYHNLGVSLYLTGDVEPAADTLMLSFQVDSIDAMNAFYLGVAKKDLQQYDEALKYLWLAADLSGLSTFADLLAQVANTHDRMGETEAAIKTYRLAMGLYPEKIELLFHLAALYDTFYEGPSMALDHYERFLEKIEAGTLPRMESYAKARVSEIKEQLFFEEGRNQPTLSLPDSTGAQE